LYSNDSSFFVSGGASGSRRLRGVSPDKRAPVLVWFHKGSASGNSLPARWPLLQCCGDPEGVPGGSRCGTTPPEPCPKRNPGATWQVWSRSPRASAAIRPRAGRWVGPEAITRERCGRRELATHYRACALLSLYAARVKRAADGGAASRRSVNHSVGNLPWSSADGTRAPGPSRPASMRSRPAKAARLWFALRQRLGMGGIGFGGRDIVREVVQFFRNTAQYLLQGSAGRLCRPATGRGQLARDSKMSGAC